MMFPSSQQTANSSSVLVSYETFQGVEQTNSSVIEEIEDGEFIPEVRMSKCWDPTGERNRPLKYQLVPRSNYNFHHCPPPQYPYSPPKFHRWTQQYAAIRIHDATGTAPWIRLAREKSRRLMNAMKKTVEISSGNEDFAQLMKAEFGKDVMQSWRCATEVFEDSTGLRLIPDSDG